MSTPATSPANDNAAGRAITLGPTFAARLVVAHNDRAVAADIVRTCCMLSGQPRGRADKPFRGASFGIVER